jgi:hypothetical protein
MSKFKIKKKEKPQPWWKKASPVLLGLGGLLLVGVAAFLIAQAYQPEPRISPQVSGPPALYPGPGGVLTARPDHRYDGPPTRTNDGSIHAVYDAR